ncbi:DUF2800 domain-containing protein [Ruminococcus flavefaciens]|uniref:DUF2800 domain-containing protein n=1 Tax=Ruminococcus flavefaciens TaxID=1265 RepID=UPI0026EFEEE0|nr:DUF2800 domain-containing protein [Ruminococcus flavefaciens]
MPDVHALLSASSSKQWLHCPPSVRLQEGFPNESSVYAEEGTFAHEICEYKVRRYLHERVKRPQSEEYDTEEIEQITDMYAEFVITIIEQMKANGCEPMAFVEERVDYSHIAPSGFGTADMIIIGKDENGRGLLHICDFKTGKGVFVDADHNSQMMLYALGALAAYGFLYDIEIVRMSIIQPRLDNISTCEMSVKELEEWGESIKPTALLAFEGKGEQHPGDWCRFCRAKPVCKACADEALALCREDFLDLDAGAFEDTEEESDMTAPYEADTQTAVFKQPGLIPLSELAEILPTLNRISAWIEAVFAFVSSEAINHGVPIPGYKVVEGRSKRVFTDTKAVVDVAVQNGYTDLYKQTLITLTDFEKMMGKKKFNELLGVYVAKPPGKLALVPDSDPREPVDLTAAPGQEFSVLPDEE